MRHLHFLAAFVLAALSFADFSCTKLQAAELPDLREQSLSFLERWRAAFAGAPAMYSDDYWSKQGDYYGELKTLGEQVEDSTASVLTAKPQLDAPGELLLVAHEVARNPEKLTLLRTWYGQTKEKVPTKFLEVNLPPGKEKEALLKQSRRLHTPEGRIPASATGTFSPYPLRKEHAVAEYRLTWEAILLAPPFQERLHMRDPIGKSLEQFGSPRSIPLLLERFRQIAALPEKEWRDGYQISREKGIIFRGLSPHQSLEALEAILKCVSIAEERGFADIEDVQFPSIYKNVRAILAGDKYAPHRRYEALVRAKLRADEQAPAEKRLRESQRKLLQEALRIADLAKEK